ncbi:MAG TPA: DUF1501 domain-containing protein [Pirellulales bacterium]|nr:DUF1501 domain-containing protein [Pirellulales bacterium]
MMSTTRLAGMAQFPASTRREALRAGSIGLVGLGLADLFALRATTAEPLVTPAKSVLFIFLTGGLSHQDSFDLKPEAPAEVRGEFQPIATRTGGLLICEHLPLLAERSERFALVRSMSTNSNGHEEACHMLLTGRLDVPSAVSLGKPPSPNEWPSMASQVTYATRGRNNLPPAVVLPQPSVNETANVRPGQYAGKLGKRFEAWHMNIAAPCPLGNGACPHCFRFDSNSFTHDASSIFDTPSLSLPDGGPARLAGRMSLLDHIAEQQQKLAAAAEKTSFDRHREQAINVLTNPQVRAAFDVEHADAATLERYGKNKFGLSLLMAYRLVAAGVNLVQVNLGKNSSWDTHRRNFVNLKQNLLPYADRAVAALLDDLAAGGLIDTTLVVMTGEFGRTPKINKDAGRDHWGPAMTSLFAGGGVRGGTVIGATDKLAAYPVSAPQTPENLAATIYRTLGIPSTANWRDVDGRAYELCRAPPIAGLM